MSADKTALVALERNFYS